MFDPTYWAQAPKLLQEINQFSTFKLKSEHIYQKVNMLFYFSI